ncbi:hypothetical protein D0C16_12990 [Cellvibrio sp. KY-GH-1]|nr:hypothetical protein D0C16_12990 [Cellvibrio sp. KY-GH-1]
MDMHYLPVAILFLVFSIRLVKEIKVNFDFIAFTAIFLYLISIVFWVIDIKWTLLAVVSSGAIIFNFWYYVKRLIVSKKLKNLN